ncbi:hypothetical protein ACH5RR_018929 [Cinchona calisaya]|uniref:Serpin domain-containing protein n=1 Tax=Cinchona calisaya TaxID=153742 RepID=A0ABD2ZR02_9GENT
MVATGCSERTVEHLLSYIGCRDLNELKSMVSTMMSVTTTSSSSSSSGGDYYQGSGGPIRRRGNYYQGRGSNERNQFVGGEQHINGLIKAVIGPRNIYRDTGLILGNALYFKGVWDCESKFNPRRTTKRDFYLVNGAKIKVPFMTSSKSYLYGSFGDFKVLEIPYHSRFFMQFILPNKTDGLQDLLDKFKNNSPIISESSNQQNFQFKLCTARLTEFWIPKFKFSYSFEKIKFPFMQEEMELTEMLQHKPGDEKYTYISNVIHKAFKCNPYSTSQLVVHLFENQKLRHLWQTIHSCSISKKRHLD